MAATALTALRRERVLQGIDRADQAIATLRLRRAPRLRGISISFRAAAGDSRWRLRWPRGFAGIERPGQVIAILRLRPPVARRLRAAALIRAST